MGDEKMALRIQATDTKILALLPFIEFQILFKFHKQQELINSKLTSSAEIHGVANGVVAVDAERHQDVRRRIRDENLLILIFSAE
jgi:hypothetical protein